MEKFTHTNRKIDLKGIYCKQITYREDKNQANRPYMEDDFFIA